jgi:hypothetical protein
MTRRRNEYAAKVQALAIARSKRAQKAASKVSAILRSERARKAALTRKTDPGSLYRQAIHWLGKYMETASKSSYDGFRTIKRYLYKVLPESVAYGMMKDAAEMAGWAEMQSMKFAKLS